MIKCKNCKWWNTDNREHSSCAECWVFPPTVLDNVATLGNTYSYKRPITDPNEYCSLWREYVC